MVEIVPIPFCCPNWMAGRKASLAAFSMLSYICTVRAAFCRLAFFSSPCSIRQRSCGSVKTLRQGRLPNEAVSWMARVSMSDNTSRTSPFVSTSGRSYLLYTPQLVNSVAVMQKLKNLKIKDLYRFIMITFLYFLIFTFLTLRHIIHRTVCILGYLSSHVRILILALERHGFDLLLQGLEDNKESRHDKNL